MFARQITLAGAVLAMMSPAAFADSFTWTAGDQQQPRSWTDPDNWSSNPDGYPDSADDTAVIPSNYNGANYPLFDDSTARTIKSFKVLNVNASDGYTVLEIQAADSSRVLKIEELDGLDPGEGAIELNRNSQLWLKGGGVLPLAGELKFDSENCGTSAERPQLVLGDGTVLFIQKGEDGIVTSAQEKGGLIRGEITSPDKDETLILEPNLTGAFAIDTAFVNIGTMTTFVGGEGDFNHALRLSCLPKAGYGGIDVEQPGTSHTATLIIDAPYMTLGLINVNTFGVLKVNRHLVAVTGTNIYTGGKAEIRKKILFETGTEPSVCIEETQP